MTQHHHTPPPDPMPLDPEERALAARLARLGPHGEPSPALDARVLAAAHAASSTRSSARATAQRGGRANGARRARWPVGVGVAASVVLAAGIAWEMRPSPAPPPAPGGVAMEATPTAPVADAARASPLLREDATPPVDAAARRAPPSRALAPPAEEPAVVFDAPSPVAAQAPPPAPPAPQAAVALPAPAPPPAAAATAATAAKRAMQTQAKAQAALPAIDASEADAPESDVPPATAASPEVRDAWLARIRELAAGGRSDEARASLSEFRRRYPAFAIPEDLQPLMAEPATSQPAPATTTP